jgi:hypothetical protein
MVGVQKARGPIRIGSIASKVDCSNLLLPDIVVPVRQSNGLCPRSPVPAQERDRDTGAGAKRELATSRGREGKEESDAFRSLAFRFEEVRWRTLWAMDFVK